MPLIIKPVEFPLDQRNEFETMFNVFNNMGNWDWFKGTGLADVQEWFQTQPFTVVMYRGWWHTFLFDHTDSFLLTLLAFPEYSWRPMYSQPAEFMPFFLEWKAQDDAKEQAYFAKVRAQRISNGEILDTN